MLLISLSIILIVRERALVDEAFPCASQIDIGILQDKGNPEEIYDELSRQRNIQPEQFIIKC